MRLHQIDIKHTITISAAKTLAHILIYAQGLETPILVKVTSPSFEEQILIE